MKNKKWHISRRDLMKYFGASVALPYLDIMFLSDKAMAQELNDKNFVLMCFDTGTLDMNYLQTDGKNTAGYQTIRPWYVEEYDRNTMNFTGNLPSVFAPLDPYKEDFQLLTQVKYVKNQPGDGADGHYTGQHYIATGVSSHRFTTEKLGRQSLDDVILEEYKRKGFVGQSINFAERRGRSNQRGRGILPVEYVDCLSFQKNGTPNSPYSDAEKAFRDLFGGVVNQNPQLADEQRKGKKIIDFLKDLRTELNRSVSSADKRVLDQYYNSMSEIESSVNEIQKRACEGASLNNLGAAGRESMLKTIGLSFQCGIAKTATYANCPTYQNFLTGEFASFMRNDDLNFTGRALNINETFHDTVHACHSSGVIDIQRSNLIGAYTRHQTRAFSDLIQVLKSLPAPGGSVFDNTLMFASWDMQANTHRDFGIRGFLAGGKNTGFIGNKVNSDVLDVRDIHSMILKSFKVDESRYHNGIRNVSDNLYKKIFKA